MSTLTQHVRHGCVVGLGLAAVAGSANRAAAQDRPLAADFEEVYRVGGLNAPEWAFFEDSSPVEFDAAGNLFVLDPAAGHVVIMDPRGGLARIVGRKGEGPGEFKLVSDILVWPAGQLAVVDNGHNAFHLFGPDGTFDRSIKMGGGEEILARLNEMRSAMRPDPGSNAVIAQGVPNLFSRIVNSMAEFMGTDEAKGVDERGLERLDLSGDTVVVQPVLQAWRPAREEPADVLSPEDLMSGSLPVEQVMGERKTFEPRLIWDLLPDGTIAWCDSSAYAIKFARPNGPVTDVLRRPIEPEAVTRDLRSATIERQVRAVTEDREKSSAEAIERIEQMMPGLFESLRKQIEKQSFFPEVPVVRGLRATWDGGLWIQRRGEEPWDNSGPIDVFGADREYIGTFGAGALEMPAAFGPDGMVVYWEFDELDVPSIVVKRLPADVR